MAASLPAALRDNSAARIEAGASRESDAGVRESGSMVGSVPASSMLHARALTKRYGKRVALDALDLEVRAGEALMLLGPNGAGKTTFMHLCAGLLRPDSGEILLAGASPSRPSARAVLGLVPQALAIYPKLSVRENLQFFARVLGVPRDQHQARIRDGLELSGLASRAHERAGGLSGGMQRRLNFACAVLHRPSVLLLDEPTVGVDPQSREHLYRAMQAQRQAGVTLVCSTHLLDEAERLGDRVVVMQHGRVRADGTPLALKAQLGARDLHELVLQLTGSETGG